LKVPIFVDIQNMINRWNKPLLIKSFNINGDSLSISLDSRFKGINPLPPKALIAFSDPKSLVTITVTFSNLEIPLSSVSSNFVWKFG